MFSNTVPVIAGFHPDPTVCRRGEDYYLANSSFEYFPGAPLFHSTDLVRWTRIGNVISRPGQFVFGDRDSGGILGSTLRYHDGRFWFITTNANDFMRGIVVYTATDPAGEWSDPVYIEGAIGFDPDLSWDDKGTCYLTYAMIHQDKEGSYETAIGQAVVDPEAGTLLSRPRLLWTGTGLGHVEGPHLHHIGDWWYLLAAEGGTGRGHVVSAARSISPTGPFEPAPQNPILTHRSTAHPVQAVGHADLVQTPDGWAMVHLGIRPRGPVPEGVHVIGRETFLAGVDWTDDGWPTPVEDRYRVSSVPHDFVERFQSPSLHPRWIAPGADPADYTRATGNGLEISAETDARRSLLTRVMDHSWRATADLEIREGSGGLLLRMDGSYWCSIQSKGEAVRAVARLGDLRCDLGEVRVDPSRPLSVALEAVATPDTGPDKPSAPDEISEDGEHELARLDGRFLSTEVAGGYTGRTVGLFADGGSVEVSRFEYRSSRPGL